MGNGYRERAVPARESLPMNRGFLMVLIPAFLVAVGCIVIFRYLGVTPGYIWQAGAMFVFFAGVWWLGGRCEKRTDLAKSN